MSNKRKRVTEVGYKIARGAEGLLYGENGNRDKFGNFRDKHGGRPKLVGRKLAGVDGGARSNRQQTGDERRYEPSA